MKNAEKQSKNALMTKTLTAKKLAKKTPAGFYKTFLRAFCMVFVSLIFSLLILPLSPGYNFTYKEETTEADLTAYYAESQSDDPGDALNQNIDEIIKNLEDSELNDLLKDLSDDELDIFGSLSFMDKLKQIINGEDTTGFNSVFSYLISLFFGDLTKLIPFMLSILGICAAFAIINSLKGNFAEASIGNAIKFACVSIIAVILFSQIFSLISAASKTVNSINKQINVVFPVILTLMTATGSTGAVAAYSPAVAILGELLTKIITVLALPCFILSIVFEIVGSLSDTVKLKKLSAFFFSALKWVLGTAFFVFLAFLSVKGITASIRDGISIRTAKFALSNYVPIIGGYLSEGFNLVMAGSVLIKNAVGLSGVILLLLTVAPLIVNIMVFSLSLSLLGAVVEPLGLDGVSSIMTGVGKSLKSLTAIILGMTFLYFIFLLLTICTGNLTL